jgi:amidophosphoribosyltransferase
VYARREVAEELRHECGIAALCALDGKTNVTPIMPRLLLDLQNRGQLAAGLSSYLEDRDHLISTYKDIGTVSEVFRTSHPARSQAILSENAGTAVIGHTRYATTGADDVRCAQPFERRHSRRWKWFAFAFNGTLSNYRELRDRLEQTKEYHFSLQTDTEIIMHSLAHGLSGDRMPDLKDVMRSVAAEFDGAYVLAFLDAMGRMFVARDPLGIRPVSYGVEQGLFGAASESVALRNAGFKECRALEPGEMVIIEKGQVRVERYVSETKRARCFFEWVYFSNVASEIDGQGVYASRAASGKNLAQIEDQPIDKDCVVVPVPDTAKAAADAFAYALHVPCMEGIIRNRYVGRTFIQPNASREQSARSKYTPLPSVLSGKRVFLVEDSIVRSTTLKVLAHQLREMGGAREVHVRVACPPIIAPCFYGIDMSTLTELFAASYIGHDAALEPDRETLDRMAAAVGADSLRYLPVSSLGKTIGVDQETLCLGCVSGRYPTQAGQALLACAKEHARSGETGRLLDERSGCGGHQHP